MSVSPHSDSPELIVVGAGFSGTLTVVNLLRHARAAGMRLALIERRSRLGRGLAYHTWDDNLLLNVPAGNMSALPDVPAHFVEYLRNIDPAFNAGSFVSRRIYGDYLEHTLAQTQSASGAVLQRITGDVIAVRPDGRGADAYVVELVDGRSLHADRIVLALGHFPPRNPTPHSDFFASEAYVADPWNFEALDRMDAGRPIAILGAGHTAVDALFRLTSHSDTRKVYLISRRGLLTHGHRFTPKAPTSGAGLPEYLSGLPNTALAHLRAIRRETRRKLLAGDDWRDVINELRPHTQGIWQRLSVSERTKFLRRVVPYWDIHRHRFAPAAFLRLEQMRASGQVEVIAGQVRAFAQRGAETLVSIRQRRDGSLRELMVGTVVNCTGPNYDIATLTIPLIVQLRDEGLIRQDPLKLGIEVDERYRVLDSKGDAARGLYYVGPMLKARYWEAIAVPELRAHALRLALQLVAPSVAG
jgi:uncharacterized NAD(P)/FAD-binding protein YdhS